MLISQLPSNSIVKGVFQNFVFFDFMMYEGVQIPIYRIFNTDRLSTVTSLISYSDFEDYLQFYSISQIHDYFVSNNIHVGVHNDEYYLYASVNENFIYHGYPAVRPLPSSFNTFGLCWTSNSPLNLFLGVRAGVQYFDSLAYESLFDHPLTLRASSFLYFFYLNSVKYDQFIDGDYGDLYNFDVLMRFYGYLIYPCCYPDFAPILKTLGGTPSSDQLANLKSICQFLGVDTSENGLSGCELMKEYLRRSNQNLGGTQSTEPNDNLKSICYLLGVDTSENGLSGCELSKDYVKRDGIMLGAEYA